MDSRVYRKRRAPPMCVGSFATNARMVVIVRKPARSMRGVSECMHRRHRGPLLAASGTGDERGSPGKLHDQAMPLDGVMGAMAEDVKAVVDALEEGRRYERSERERRIGTTYLVSALSVGGTFVAYGALMLAPWEPPMAAWMLLWAPFVGAAVLVRRRLFRRLPTETERITGLPPGFAWAFVAMWLAAGMLVGGVLERGDLVWPAVAAVFGLAFLVQARRFRDRMHAWLGAGVLAGATALALVRPPMGVAALALGVGIGGALAVLGLVRRSRA